MQACSIGGGYCGIGLRHDSRTNLGTSSSDHSIGDLFCCGAVRCSCTCCRQCASRRMFIGVDGLLGDEGFKSVDSDPGWKAHYGSDVGNVTEHSFSSIVIVLSLGRQ
jgi:hypothetical protein